MQTPALHTLLSLSRPRVVHYALCTMNTTKINRQIQNLIRIGTIVAVDHAAKQLKIKSGELVTNWIDCSAEIGRNYTRSRTQRLKTQVILSCPAGDPAQAMIIAMLFNNDIKSPPTDSDIDLIAFDNDSYIEHHHTNMTVRLHSAGDFTITAAGNITIQAPRVDINP